MPRYSLRFNRQRAERPEQPFPFLKLPAEIRNTIYKLVVVASSPIMPLKRIRKRVLDLDVYDNSNHVQPNITKVSRQIRQQALPLYYSENVFDFTNRQIQLHKFERIGANDLKSIRAIELTYIGRPSNLKVKISPDSAVFIVSFSWDRRTGWQSIPTKPTEEEMRMVIASLRQDAELTEFEKISGLHLVKIVEKLKGVGGYTSTRLANMVRGN